MKFYGVIFNKDLDERKRDHWIPLDWPMFLTLLKDDEYPPAGIARMSLDEVEKLKNELWTEYENLQAQKKEYFTNNLLRIHQLVAYEFKEYHPSKIDFTKHLKSDVFLEKRDVIMLKNGRPQKAIYYFGETKIAEMIFEFEVDSLNFMTRRTEKLGYYKVDDSVGEYYKISDEYFSGSISYQHNKRLAERITSRKNIIDSLSADIDRMLTIAAQQAPTQSAALSAMINAFWVEYNPHIQAFISTGGSYLRSKFENDSTYPFLNSLVAPSVTARMYIVDKLTY